MSNLKQKRICKMEIQLELCCRCGDPTGRAGRADDSLYTDDDLGPYCWDCWDDAEYWRDKYVSKELK